MLFQASCKFIVYVFHLVLCIILSVYCIVILCVGHA